MSTTLTLDASNLIGGRHFEQRLPTFGPQVVRDAINVDNLQSDCIVLDRNGAHQKSVSSTWFMELVNQVQSEAAPIKRWGQSHGRGNWRDQKGWSVGN